MGYNMQNGQWADTQDLTVVGAGARVASFQSAGVEVGDRGVVCLDLVVTAGTGTLDVAIETSKDNSTWRSLGSFAQKTGAATERKSFAGVDRFVRANSTLASSPNFTFSIAGEAK